eukprot:1157224-Pelagomonas_calceolata.AAC.11
MYQNLRDAIPEAEALPSVHFCDVPPVVPEHPGDARIRQSVARMQVGVGGLGCLSTLGMHVSGRAWCACKWVWVCEFPGDTRIWQNMVHMQVWMRLHLLQAEVKLGCFWSTHAGCDWGGPLSRCTCVMQIAMELG